MDFSKLEKLIDTMPQRGIPFFELAVTKDGKEVFRRSVGCSDSAQTKKLQKDDLYWLFSATKPITCTCAMRLVEQGVIKLSDPVSRYIPAFKDLLVRKADGSAEKCKTELTLEHLFTMTSGIGRDHERSPIVREAIGQPNANTLSILSVLPKIPLYFEPGTHYQYGLSHDVLAGVVEVAAGMRYRDYVQKYVLDSLGMTNTGFHPTDEIKKRFAAMYRYDSSNGTSQLIPTENNLVFTPDYDSGGAGLYGCCEDYIKFLTVLACGGTTKDGYRLLSEESIAQMGQNRLCKDALTDFVKGRLYGYGWGLCGRVLINPVYSLSKSQVGEFGWDGATGCFAMVDRKSQTAIFFGMQVHFCGYSYVILQPLIRNLVYEALEG